MQMKFFLTVISFCFLAITTQAQIENCDCEWNIGDETVCATDSTGLIFPLPNECFANCLGLSIVDNSECDYDWDDDWEWEWDDEDGCDCEWDLEEDFICVLTDVETGLVCAFPNLCFAECAGYSADDIVEEGCDDAWVIDSLWLTDFDFETDFDCDCDFDPEAEFVCAQDSLGNIFPMPNECYATCFGLTIVTEDCGLSDWGDDWNDDDLGFEGCDCDESAWETGGICIEVTASFEEGDSTETFTFEAWVPSECYADCWGYENYTVVECTNSDEWEDDDWNFDDCDCDESAWESEGICIEITETFESGDTTETFTVESWVPSECYADCWGYENYTVVECPDDEWDEPWTDCDCEIDIADSPVCILTDAETGEICPFPNLCLAECAGYTADDVVSCIEIDIECFECFSEETDPVCVESDGVVFPVPNACFAECLGLTIVDGECEDFNLVDNGGTEEADPSNLIGSFAEENYVLDDTDNGIAGFKIYPNPTDGQLNFKLNMEVEVSAMVEILSLSGQRVVSQNYNLTKGKNALTFDVNSLTPGVYMINVIGQERLISKRFIKE